MGPRDYRYPGTELELFSLAVNWKRYWAGKIKEFLGRKVLEVGAGVGGTTAVICDAELEWSCLEPDMSLIARLRERLQKEGLSNCTVATGTISDLPKDTLFDSILYIDVLEHIEQDKLELSLAAKHLRSGGHLIVLVPSHQFLLSPFDAATGHFRRYSRHTLLNICPAELKKVFAVYLDSIGFLALLMNRAVLRFSTPTQKQILFWDRYLIKLSRVTDKIFFRFFGRSLLAVWRKE